MRSLPGAIDLGNIARVWRNPSWGSPFFCVVFDFWFWDFLGESIYVGVSIFCSGVSWASPFLFGVSIFGSEVSWASPFFRGFDFWFWGFLGESIYVWVSTCGSEVSWASDLRFS